MTRLDGVTFVDHTADVGMDVVAPTLEALFHRAALGMLALVRGQDEGPSLAGGAAGGPPPQTGAERAMELAADDAGRLLAAWLKELLFLHEARQADYAGATFTRLSATELRARVRSGPAEPAAREIKGVTYHELEVRETDDGWKARVIFDV